MSASRIILRLIIILGCAFFAATIGIAFQARRITGRPQEFRSMAKLVANMPGDSVDSAHWREQQQDFYGTIIETLESSEMSLRALERVRALNPDLKGCEVAIRVAQSKGSAIFNILATGSEPKYTRIFLDALLDEFISFRQSIRESAQGRTLQEFLQAIVTQQKNMEVSMAALEKARAKAGTPSSKSDQERILARLNSLRNQRDDLRMKIKPMPADDAARATLQAQLSTLEQEVQGIESDLQRLEPALSELRTLTEKHEMDKLAYEKLFEQAEKLQATFNSSSDYVTIQERASPSSENVEDWKLPIAVGAGGGALVGGLIGLVLSLLLVRSPKPPQVPAAVG